MAAAPIVAQPVIRPHRPRPSRRTLSAKLRTLDRFIAANKKLEAARSALAEAAFSGDPKREAKAKKAHERAYLAHRKALWNL